MRVFSYDKERIPVAVDLALSEVVGLGIHPWWVDVFDPNPVVRKVNGQTLSFTRLREISFRYREGDLNVVGVLGRSGAFTAFCGRGSEQNPRDRALNNPRPMRIDFETAFARFLESIGRLETTSLARSSGGLLLRNNRLVLDDDADCPEAIALGRAQYAGRMAEGVRITHELPPSLRWVFKVFRRWSPTIIGGALRDTLLGREPADVDFIVDYRGRDQVRRIERELEKAGAEEVQNRTNEDHYGHALEHPVFSFRFEGVKYDLISRGNPLSDRHWLLSDFSVNQLRADEPGVVTASRIALWDLSRQQCRFVSRAPQNSDLRYHWPDRAKKMREKGFSVLSNSFSIDQNENFSEVP